MWITLSTFVFFWKIPAHADCKQTSLTRISMLQADGVRWATKRLGIPVRSAPNTAEAVLTVKRSKPRQWVDSVEGSNPRTQLAHECDSGLFISVWYLIEREASVATTWQQTFTVHLSARTVTCLTNWGARNVWISSIWRPAGQRFLCTFLQIAFKHSSNLTRTFGIFCFHALHSGRIGPSGSSIARQCVETCPINTFHLGAAWQMMASGWVWPIWFKRPAPEDGEAGRVCAYCEKGCHSCSTSTRCLECSLADSGNCPQPSCATAKVISKCGSATLVDVLAALQFTNLVLHSHQQYHFISCCAEKLFEATALFT